MDRNICDLDRSKTECIVDDSAICADEEDNNITIQTFSNDDTVRDSSPIRRKPTYNLHRLRFVVTDVMMRQGEGKSLVQTDTRERNRFFRTPRIGSRRIRNRLVQKYGLCNISLANVPKQRRKYFSDIFTTVIEVKWRWSLLFFAMSFFLSWTFFFSLYYLIILSHGDFDHIDDPTWNPCIVNGNSKINIFLFSFTTQTTIGYGFRYPTAECPLVIVTMCLQFMIGVMCQTLMAGVIFAKLARPIKRAATILFSKNAVICMRDGKLCLLFRVGDMRKSSLAEAHVRLQMIKKCITYEGELLPFHQFDMDVGYDEGLDRVFVIWPITICHEIDENSPLYEVSKETLETSRFEIIAILEGVVESVGSTTQARTSYLPNEILWGKRFEKLVTYQRENGEYRIDFEKFHNVYDVDTPTCSAKQLDEMRAAGLKPEDAYQVVSRMRGESNGATPKVAVHTSKKVSDMSVIPIKENASMQRVKIESDDEDEEYDNSITVDVGLKHKKSIIRSQSPEFPIRHKQSTRRGPDLF
uniref:G protein-activated inward rectifier potassium channel 3 n=1 Tax=Parascaris univalens TaxID=6257 RepID=A0A915BZ06_PARUN